MPNNPQWFIQVPLRVLQELQGMVDELHQLRDDNKVLKSRLDALHRTLYDLMEQLSIMRRGGQLKG